MMILVLMDLSSGYLVLESIENDRSFDTWFSTTEPRLNAARCGRQSTLKKVEARA